MSNISPKIIIRTPNWLGDLIIATGFVSAVLERYPYSEVDLILKSGFESLPFNHRGKIIIFDPKKYTPGNFGKTFSKDFSSCSIHFWEIFKFGGYFLIEIFLDNKFKYSLRICSDRGVFLCFLE